MDTDNNIIDPMTANIPLIKTNYEKKATAIKAYLARRYNTDAEWRDMINKRRAFNQSLKYNSDPEHRVNILQRRRELKQIKRDEANILILA
jgi:hypothetical protein